MTRRLVCVSVQPALSKCEAALKNWRELLQRAHDSVSAEVFFNLAVALGLIWHGLVVLGLVCIFNWTAIAFVYNLFYRRAELEHTYSKGLQKLAGKLLRASKEMSRK